MSHIKALRVRNLRGLEDTGFIELKPITVLVGRNSAGKSTFARVWPLLKQSVEANKRSPILWFGRYVDFGSFGEALRSNSQDKRIEFAFRIRLTDLDRSDLRSRLGEHFTQRHRTLDVELNVKVIADEESGGTSISEMRVTMFGHSCTLHFGAGGRDVQNIVSGDFVWTPSGSDRQEISFRSFLPSIQFYQIEDAPSEEGARRILYQRDILYSALLFSISLRVHGNVARDTIAYIARYITIGPDEVMLGHMKSMVGAPSSWVSLMRDLNTSSYPFKQIRDRVFAHTALNLLPFLDDALSAAFVNAQYLEPLRATAQRYYRRQELATDEIDSKGANIAFYLDSLNLRHREIFDEWMKSQFQLAVHITRESGHLSLLIQELPAGEPRNIADIGFGFSQVLPIAVQLWASSNRPLQYPMSRILQERRRATRCIVLEQPELHLHPEFQAKLADVVVACTRPNRGADHVAIVAETHSPSFVNRLGALISEGCLAAGDVQILLFERNEDTACSEVHLSHFDDKGVLQNWPYGFFEPK